MSEPILRTNFVYWMIGILIAAFLAGSIVYYIVGGAN